MLGRFVAARFFRKATMKRYVIEREIPGIGSFDAKQLHTVSQQSMQAIRQLGFEIQWEHSYLTADRSYCIYLANGEAVIRIHAELSGFPANRITEVTQVLDPTWAE